MNLVRACPDRAPKSNILLGRPNRLLLLDDPGKASHQIQSSIINIDWKYGLNLKNLDMNLMNYSINLIFSEKIYQNSAEKAESI